MLVTDADPLRFDLLGPFRVRRGAAEVRLPSRYQGSLLALLLVRGGGLVEMPEIIDLLWEGDAPPTAVNMVHRYVGIVRRVLEPGLPTRSSGRWLLREAGGYRLRLPGNSLDLLEFRAQINTARQRFGAGDHRAATDAFITGLDLWKGRCAAGLGDGVQQHPAFVAVEQEYVSAVRAAAGSARLAGMPARVLPALRAAAYRHPLDEALQGALVLALAADGKQAEAIEVYGHVRARLADDLGVDPGPDLAAAFTAILRDEVPSARQPIADPPPTDSVRTEKRAPAASATVRPRPGQLPPGLRVFAGRTGELQESVGRLTSPAATPQILAFDGMAGVGKTTLAVHLAHQIAAEFPDGHLYADLHGSTGDTRLAVDPAHLLGTFLTALGFESGAVPAALDARAALFRSAVAGRRMLIVLDDARDVDQVRPLLPGSAGNAVVITSRRRLTELATRHGAHLRQVDVMTAQDSRDCLSARIGSARTSAEPAAVDDIIARCGRLPLALAIVAVRASTEPGQPLHALAADLLRHHGTLEAFDHEDADGLREALASPCRALSAETSRLLNALAVMPDAPVTAETAATHAGIPYAQARLQLAELAHAGLLSRSSWSSFQLHALVRAYVCELGAGRSRAMTPDDRRRHRLIAA